MNIKLMLSIATIFLISCGGKKFDQQSYEQQKQNIAAKEKKNPLLFLRVEGDNKKNVIGKTAIHGKILNKATICSYKNIRIKMLCFKNNKMMEEHEDVLNDVIKPNDQRSFKIKYRLPKGTDSITLSIMSAAAE
jgi:hypothetical protein